MADATQTSSQLTGQVLEEAALAAAAEAVAQEAAAARAAGGAGARLLASSGHRPSLAQALRRFEVNEPQEFNATNATNATKARKNAYAQNPGATGGAQNGHAYPSNPMAPATGGINPFNPFSNPFFNPFAPNPYAAFTGGGGRGNLLFYLFLGIVGIAACAVVSGFLGEEEEEESSGDDGNWLAQLEGTRSNRRRRDRMAQQLAPGEEGGRRWRFCCCFPTQCCSKTVILFFLMAMLVTFLGAKILWNSGVLQPLLAQLLLYTYVIALLMGFVVVVTWEATRKIRRSMDQVLGNLSNLDNFMPFFGKNQRAERSSPRF
ncbi:unnamed protein product [Effrenium voratum]|nr:unnamed protein product [Effrenium voratum]